MINRKNRGLTVMYVADSDVDQIRPRRFAELREGVWQVIRVGSGLFPHRARRLCREHVP